MGRDDAAWDTADWFRVRKRYRSLPFERIKQTKKATKSKQDRQRMVGPAKAEKLKRSLRP